jgi:hypothetical protein
MELVYIGNPSSSSQKKLHFFTITWAQWAALTLSRKDAP